MEDIPSYDFSLILLPPLISFPPFSNNASYQMKNSRTYYCSRLY